MALFKSETVQDEPVIGQHYLVCGTEDCEKNCQFYCNDCHRSLCERCRDEHQKGMDTKIHEVVPYRERRRQLPVEKCKDHSNKIKQVNKMEESLIEELHTQDNTYKDYISYLENLVKEFNGYLSSTELLKNPIIVSLVGLLNIQPIPETTKPVHPVFTAGQYSKEDVTKLLGGVTVPDIKPEVREIKYLNTASIQLKPTESGEKQTFSVTKVREYTVPGVKNVWHISLGKPGRLWLNDRHGNLVQTDQNGNQLKRTLTSGREEGYHTVTQDGDLIYKDLENKVINRITQNNTVIEYQFIKTKDWTPLSIYSSHINGDILVGMIKGREAKVTKYNKTKGREAKVTKYNKTGEEIQNIKRDNKRKGLYGVPHYITENINGDICTSDYKERAVVVVNKSGQHRFSYTGQRLRFLPFSICTDLLGHILVCDGISNTVHLLDQDGQFLSLLLTPEQHKIGCPRGMCVDTENNLYMGQYFTKTVSVYKYSYMKDACL
uniref:Tripartite motif-containing protein 2 n=1 Tax=Magallana gigas TaxID=29159 RepID=K1Q5A6_MAGGI